MSDQQDKNKNIEQLAQETAASGENMQPEANGKDQATAAVASEPARIAQADADLEEEPKAAGESGPAETVEAARHEADHAGELKASGESGPAAPVAAPPPRRGSSAVAWIALLLVLVVAGGLGWAVWEQQRRDARVAARLQAVEAEAGREVQGLDELRQGLQNQLETALGQIRAETSQRGNQAGQLAGTLEAVQAELSGQRAELDEQRAALDRQRSELIAQRAALARYDASDSSAWSLAEARYLLRMAHQRMIMAGDVVAARALLGSADDILLALDDPGMHDVRAAVASDLAALRAVPRVDVEGAYLRLAALLEQSGKLVIFQLPQRAEGPERAPAEGWQGPLQEGWEAALARLSNYIVIRRRDVPMQALMDPQWEGLVRQNLRMLLQQAQVALLSGNQMLYRDSLEQAQSWVGEFFASDEAVARAMSREITQLMDIEIAVSLPDISTSVQALDAFTQQGLQRGGAE